MDSKRKSIKKCDPNQITAGNTDEDQAVAIAARAGLFRQGIYKPG